jgi:hypothetical protein
MREFSASSSTGTYHTDNCAYDGSSWPCCGQGGGLAVRSPVRTLPPRAYGGALVVWPGMPFPNLDGRIHKSPVFYAVSTSLPLESSCCIFAGCALNASILSRFGGRWLVPVRHAGRVRVGVPHCLQRQRWRERGRQLLDQADEGIAGLSAPASAGKGRGPQKDRLGRRHEPYSHASGPGERVRIAE